MQTYRAPLRDMRFVLDEVLGIGAHFRELRRSDLAFETSRAILAQAAKFSEEVIAPLNAAGDSEGARYEEGRVATPAGYAEAYRQFCGAGWPTISAPAAYGGQNLPACVDIPITEMLSAASLSWRTYSGLSTGAIALLSAHASPDIRARYVPKLVSGEWLPTMCLTEPQCGTDLALIRTRAQPAAHGSYRISGSKLFITGGEHDLTSNIVHLVLARLPQAPAGARGISLFVVPKFLSESQALSGKTNGILCTAIESKMGLRGSATCALAFNEAQGWLIGEPHGGLACMFTMMNLARLEVGVQALGTAQLAHQQSISYAYTRLQGRSPSRQSSKEADPIVVHPDVRRMLLTQRSLVEGCRMLVYYTAMQMDVSRDHPDENIRRTSRERIALLTPIVKAFTAAVAVECADLAVQLHGGHGYIKDTGIEQVLRDARVLPIYEGTNGVQALDLLGRKIIGDDGCAFASLRMEILTFCEGQQREDRTRGFIESLSAVLREWDAVARELLSERVRNSEEVGAAAWDFLQLSGLTCLAWCWAQMAVTAVARLAQDPADVYYSMKLATAQFFFARLLPRSSAHAAACRAGVKSLSWPSPDEESLQW